MIANVEKIKSGIPLTDADCWDWLTFIRKASIRHLTDGARGVVVTSSALKRKYRDVIRVANLRFWAFHGMRQKLYEVLECL